jgi:chromosome partitioning protein
MFSFRGAGDLHKIVVLNPKGGSGKTTLATNLASLFAVRGATPTLIDCDPQGFCMRWLQKRPPDRPAIYGIQADEGLFETTEPFALDIRPDSRVAIFDLPAGIAHERLHACTYMADRVVLPIMPSAIDVHSATRFIAELLLDAQLDRSERKLAIVANRVRSRTISYQMLMRFLTTLRIPLIATLRDSQSFVHASASGIGLCEMPGHRAGFDLLQLNALAAWLERPRATGAAQSAAAGEQTADYRPGLSGFGSSDPLEDGPAVEHKADTELEFEAS